MRRIQVSISLSLLTVVALFLPVIPAFAETELWQDLRQGRSVALIRHAVAPGTGDPPGFELDDCSTQRTLSDEGRRQARALGDLFRSRGVGQARVLSSRWCRCLETAELLGLGLVKETAPLDSFFGDRKRGAEQTEATRQLIRAHLESGKKPLVLVTHQVNITALNGIYPSSGEIIFLSLEPEGATLTVEGRMEPEF